MQAALLRDFAWGCLGTSTVTVVFYGPSYHKILLLLLLLLLLSRCSPNQRFAVVSNDRCIVRWWLGISVDVSFPTNDEARPVVRLQHLQ